MSAIRSGLLSAADPARAAGAQAYLKSEMPSLGVRVPEVRRIVKDAARRLPPGSLPALQSTVLELWRGASWREERYAAIDLTGLRLAAGEMTMLPLYEEIIRSGAWWDLVDGVSHRLCGLLQSHRQDMSAVLRDWSSDADLWSGGLPSRRSWAPNPPRTRPCSRPSSNPTWPTASSLSGRRSAGPCATTPERTRTGSGLSRRGTARR